MKMKKYLSIFLTVCLLAALLPTIALAADPANYVWFPNGGLDLNVKEGTVAYAINDPEKEGLLTQKGASADNYNLKIDYTGEVPVLYIKGLKLGKYVEEESGREYIYPQENRAHGQALNLLLGKDTDSRHFVTVDTLVIEADSSIYSLQSGLRVVGDLTIESVGNAKLTLQASHWGGLYIDGDCTVTIDGANLDIYGVNIGYNPVAPAIGMLNGGKLVMKSGNLNLTTSLHQDAGDNGGACIWAMDDQSGNIDIQGGTITANCGNVTTLGVIQGKNITISGGTVNLQKAYVGEYDVNAKAALYGTENVTISGGKVTAKADQGGIRTVNGTITISGGEVELFSTGESAVFNKAPVLSGNYDVILGTDAENISKYNETLATTNKVGLYFRYGPKGSLPTPPEPTTPPTEPATEPSVPATDPATTPTDKPAPNPTDKPSDEPVGSQDTTPTEAPDPADKQEGGSGALVWVIIGCVVVLAAAGAGAFVLIKKKRAA